MEGKIKFFNYEKSFGFIEIEGGKDIFVHISGIKDDVEFKENDLVKFDVEDTPKGKAAINVSKR